MNRGLKGVGASIFFGIFASLPLAGFAQGQAESLRQALEQQGWQSQTQADGSVIFQSPASPAGEPAETTTAQDSTAAPTHNLETLLKAQGWNVIQAEDGGLIVDLPMPSATEPPPDQAAPPSAPAEEPASEDLATMPPSEASPPSAPLEGTILTQEQAGELGGLRHWTMETEPDGSVVLRPRARSTHAAAAAPVAPCDGTAVSASGVELPVDRESEARSLAAAWLEQAGLESALVGKIRKVLKIYVVSIVTTAPPHHLMHQLAVRSYDGRVLVLH